MKSSIYLYGVDIAQLPSMEHGLVVRIEKAKHLLDVLLAAPLEERDWSRITAVCEAISHNTKILNGSV